jgi:hypothetical protein
MHPEGLHALTIPCLVPLPPLAYGLFLSWAQVMSWHSELVGRSVAREHPLSAVLLDYLSEMALNEFDPTVPCDLCLNFVLGIVLLACPPPFTHALSVRTY